MQLLYELMSVDDAGSSWIRSNHFAWAGLNPVPVDGHRELLMLDMSVRL